MGVNNLWILLSEKVNCGESKKISSLQGKIVAVDLPGWIVEFRSNQTSLNIKHLFLRSLFFRIFEFLRAGVKLIFVGEKAAVKNKRSTFLKRKAKHHTDTSTSSNNSNSLDRENYLAIQEKCRQMIELIGLPYICVDEAAEAEGICSAMNQLDMVDAVISNDSDVFPYGAKCVCRNYQKHNKQEPTVEIYTAEDILEKTELNQRDFIVFAILSGCDLYEQGVSNFGKEKSLELINHLKNTGIDPLDRILNWEKNEELALLSGETSKKPTHCKNCLHTGLQSAHNDKGCQDCRTLMSCTSKSVYQCTCTWHKIQRNKLELKARKQAFQQNDFTSSIKEVIEEFQRYTEKVKKLEIKPIKPIDLLELKNFLGLHLKELYNDYNNTVTKFVVEIFLQGILVDLAPVESIGTPLKVIKKCRRNFVPSLEVEWKIPESIQQSETETVNFFVNCEQFRLKFEDILITFEGTLEQESVRLIGKKRKTETTIEDTKQSLLTSFFAKKK